MAFKVASLELITKAWFLEYLEISRFCSQFSPIPKIENSKNSEICILLQILTVVGIEYLNATKI